MKSKLKSGNIPFRELWGFVSDKKKGWQLPIFIVWVLFGVLIVLGDTGLRRSSIHCSEVH